MAKPLSAKVLLKRQLTMRAIKDYYGAVIPEESFMRILRFLQGRGSHLSREEMKAAKAIKVNLSDKIYLTALTSGV